MSINRLEDVNNHDHDHRAYVLLADSEAVASDRRQTACYHHGGPLSTGDSSMMKKRLQSHFRSHIQKWMDKDHPRFPWKAALHILLVGLVTAQVVEYESETHKLTNYLKNSEIIFRQYFNISDSRKVTLDQVYEQLTQIVTAYYNIPSQSLINYAIMSPTKKETQDSSTCPNLTMAIQYIPDNENKTDCDDKMNCTGKNGKYHDCVELKQVDTYSDDTCPCDDNYSIKEQVECYVNDNTIKRIQRLAFHFVLKSDFQQNVIESENTVRANITITILLKSDSFGGMSVNINVGQELKRTGNDSCNEFWHRGGVLDTVVLVLLIISSLTYINSILITIKLYKDVKLHFLAVQGKHLRWKEISPLFNKWYLLMLFANLFICSGTILKFISDYKDAIEVDLVEAVRVLLGVGVLLLWCGLFGLIKYYEPFNVLFITVTLALPSVLNFLTCVIILFIAFALCGWLVLGPYHPKFKTFWLSIETLFTILNGDDLYVTFEESNSSFLSEEVEIISRIYLAVFIFLFIYVVLSLFIGIFSHAYESLSNDWRQRSRGYLRDWAEGEPDKDPTKNYPFPVPAVRKPDDDTAIVIIDNNVTAHTFGASNTYANNQATVPVIKLHPPVIEPDDDLPHTKSFTKSTSPRPLVRLQVAEPPKASKNEVEEARRRLSISGSHSTTVVVDETEA